MVSNNSSQTSAIPGCNFNLFGTVPAGYIFIPLAILILCENLVGILTICRYHALHTNANRFISSLALADVNVCLAFIVGDSVKLPQAGPPPLGVALTDAYLLGSILAMVIGSCVHMGIIAVDRYIYVAHPFYYMKNVTKKRVRLINLAVWIMTWFFQALPMIFYRDESYHKVCILGRPPMSYFIPGVVVYSVTDMTMFVCYFKIARLSFMHKKAATARRANLHPMDGIIAQGKIRTAMMKSIKFFCIMCGLYFTFTAIPGLVICVSVLYDLPGFYSWLLHLFVLNSGINFALYAYMCKEFSQCMKKTLVDIACCCRRSR